jgi:6-phosphogluconolactonase (cycloisomerase 2 family)
MGVFCLAAMPVAAQSHHFVYLASSTQSISGYEWNAVSASLTAVAGSPFQEGHDLTRLAFHPSGRFLYALNPNEQDVSALAVDPVSGALTELPASPFAVGAGATPKFIAVEPSGKFLYVVSTMADPLGTITLISDYSIDAAGALNPAADTTYSPGC